ncbi:MAG: hypothetical protein WC500_06050 [Candidatus Margulisiibacteriota bacterium]
MAIQKAKGQTRTERLLSALCDQTFLKLWSYANPFNEDGKELCDLIAIFENHLFIFFDRECSVFDDASKDVLLTWERWRKRVIDKQIITARGAEKYIRSGKPVFLDAKKTIQLPLEIPFDKVSIHKIIVAHGAANACKGFSEENMSGSLMVSYGEPGDDLPFPFAVHLDKADPVHVFDSYNLSIVLKELDTFYDFVSYISVKEKAINELDGLSFCGEEELLAYYFMHFDEDENMHFIKDKNETCNFMSIDQGFWVKLGEHDQYKRKKIEDQVSYLWDDFIQRTCQNAFDGTLICDRDFFKGPSAIYEMAKEPRFVRRALSKHIIQVIKSFPDNAAPITRHISFMPSFYKDKGYMFLQFYKDKITNYAEYRLVRQKMLEIACGATKNKFPHLNKVVGIAIDAPKYQEDNSEDFLLLNCEEWTDEDRRCYEEANKLMGFYKSPSLKMTAIKTNEFPN